MVENSTYSIIDNMRQLVYTKSSNFEAIRKFKSVNRAFKRGLIDENGIHYPGKPFNNRVHTLGRKHQVLKKQIYGELLGKKAI